MAVSSSHYDFYMFCHSLPFCFFVFLCIFALRPAKGRLQGGSGGPVIEKEHKEISKHRTNAEELGFRIVSHFGTFSRSSGCLSDFREFLHARSAGGELLGLL